MARKKAQTAQVIDTTDTDTDTDTDTGAKPVINDELLRQLKLIPDTPYTPMLRVIDMGAFPSDEEIPGPAPSPGLLKSVAQIGLLQPVGILASTGMSGQIRPEDICFGRRRIKAARAAGMEEIPALVFDADTPAQVLTLTEQHQRSDNLVADLWAIEDMVRRGHSVQEIAKATSMPKNELNKLMRYLSLIPELKSAFSDGKMSRAAAERALRLTEDYQHSCVDILRDKGKLTEKDVDSVARVSTASAVQELPTSLFDTDLSEEGATPWYLQAADSVSKALSAIPADHPKAASWTKKLQSVLDEIYKAG